jgi:predicted NAD/FAD-dependent oxidoreductase
MTMQMDCDISIIGAGWAGVYTAFRLQTSSTSVCLFEAYSRAGGRTYSTRAVDARYVVDAGAYRFAGDMHLPADLIHTLGLLSVCYDPTCVDEVKKEVPWPYQQPLRKITDYAGRHLGYGAAIDEMLARFTAAGGKIVLDARLTSVAADTGCALGAAAPCWRLSFADGRSARSASVVLNMPRPALAAVGGLSTALAARWPAISCTAREFPPSITEGATTTKVYAVYGDATWLDSTPSTVSDSRADTRTLTLLCPARVPWSNSP